LTNPEVTKLSVENNGAGNDDERVMEMEEPEQQDKPDDEDEKSPGEEEDDEEEDDEEDEDEQESNNEDMIREAEAKAIADATVSANASYIPSNALMSNPSPAALIESVDGISMSEYNQLPSLFMARSVPIALRATLDVPIIITNGGSIVEYTVESEDYDITFGIKAKRDDETTIVNSLTRVDSHLEAVTGKFLVGTVPCALIFTFSNEYSWFREKKITYGITVTPPTIDNIIAGRMKRAQSAHDVVLEDKTGADTRLEHASSKRSELAKEVERLEKELAEKSKTLDVVEKEENMLKARVELRGEQLKLLKKRLTEGWDDEEKAKVIEEEDEDEGVV